MSLRFGTDGIRGVANEELTPELLLALGRAAARHLAGEQFLIGRDTRRSGPMLAAAFAAGLAAEGTDVVDLGVVPTPAVAFLAQRRRLPAAVLSASHNPFADNGVKLLASGGTKLDAATELAVENELDVLLAEGRQLPSGPQGAGVGRLREDREGAEEYLAHLGQGADLAGRRFRLVVDCANGAASEFARPLFERLGCEVELLFADPDGTNINDGCGSTHPERLAARVAASGAELGFALDGDADRCLAVDGSGEVVDGDQMIALFAADLDERGELENRGVAVTVMANLGLRLALERRGIAIIETAVGDRHVTDALEAHHLVLGGEQSGHIVFANEATTGDGLRTALKLLELLARHEESLADLADAAMERVPQVLRNVGVAEPRRLGDSGAIWSAVAEAELALAGAGRVLVRASGTEPAVRVMVEAAPLERASAIADGLARVIDRELGAGEH